MKSELMTIGMLGESGRQPTKNQVTTTSRSQSWEPNPQITQIQCRTTRQSVKSQQVHNQCKTTWLQEPDSGITSSLFYHTQESDELSACHVMTSCLDFFFVNPMPSEPWCIRRHEKAQAIQTFSAVHQNCQNSQNLLWPKPKHLTFLKILQTLLIEDEILQDSPKTNFHHSANHSTAKYV